ncbi:C1 family peptidase, partial [Lentimicrobium sp.]|uniref:C1 family peptidase n=1 Tax=Lentimicrobium sp. TaxID=2034841 RepID=UPI00345E391E
QEDFNNLKATDDHLMHITGLATDQLGTRYYITKNSWAADSNKSGGYLNMSEAYVRLNTIAVMVHKDSVPPLIRKKLGI